ncbi:type 1 fimbrial protein [Salmonella enterica]|nr:type 1 fimbrial protein [Salmonella enterica]ELM6819959.1 type 1 fimbrial protein [Salmonella enterica]ELV6917999.1 type 1 fimbrial protein [Salmonella enterica]
MMSYSCGKRYFFMALMIIIWPAFVSASETSDIVFKTTIKQSACSLSTSARNVSFGSVAPGESKQSSPINININCSGDVATFVWPSLRVGGQVPGNSQGVYLLVDGKLPDVKTLIRLLDENGWPVRIMSTPAPEGVRFCEGTTTRDCKLTPDIAVQPNAETGTGRAVIVFNLVHA